MSEPLLRVDDLKMHFHTRDGVVRAVDGVTFELRQGETLGIVGESGSGKSVTAMTMMQLVPMPPGRVEGGEVILNGRNVLEMSEREIMDVRGNEVAMIFQDPMTSLNPVLRVGWQIAEPLVRHKGMSKRDALARAVELLEMVGIPHAEARSREYPHQFSGGMRQRAMIAMALSCDPDVLIADEPTTALDVTIQAQILELMMELQQRSGTAVILITHDLGVVADIADSVLVMYAGKAVEFCDTESIFYRPAHPYTWGLLDSLPRHDISSKGLLCPIKGQPPSLVDVPSGCAFHPRCPYAKDRCSTETPPLRDVGAGHLAACHFAGDVGFTRNDQQCSLEVNR